jgi:hypothetical protein
VPAILGIVAGELQGTVKSRQIEAEPALVELLDRAIQPVEYPGRVSPVYP